jgi:hypothetical protein
MITKYSLKDLRMVAKDLIKTYNKENDTKIPLNSDFWVEVSDNHTRLMIATVGITDRMVCIVL